ncbi:MAG: hypothetical protein B6D79_12985, partial [gamma proteobacterium symbiont of Ctena orbiculata]
MNTLCLSQVASSLNGTWVGEDVSFSSVSTDSRTLQARDLYVALKGPHFDGHNFIGQAIDKGAVGVMVSEPQKPEIPQLQVKDTRLGLGRLAGVWRDSFPLPLTLLRLQEEAFAVVEMGDNHPGEIGYLSHSAHPD